MRGNRSVRARADRLRARRPAGADARVARAAEELGLLPDELIDELAELAARCLAAGATTVEARTAFLAAEFGIPAGELRAEAARLAGRDR